MPVPRPLTLLPMAEPIVWPKLNGVDERGTRVPTAALLRDPPLQTVTVVSYILDTIVSENMPYDKIRLKEEVISPISTGGTISRRYKAWFL